MKSISKILLVITVLLTVVNSFAQIKNVQTATLKIYGNYEICQTTIEKAGIIKKVANVDWNKDTKMATITYNAKKTNPDEILKRIALSGYDSDKFLAPDNVYTKLPECCVYERVNKPVAKVATKTDTHDHLSHTTTAEKQDVNQLKTIFDSYFFVKDALVKSDGNTTSIKAKELLIALNAVEMNKLSNQEHTVWMQIMKDLIFDAEHISDTKNVGHQRDHFMSLSKNMYELIKVSKNETPVYYHHCPMANKGKGANWLSKENAIKNPYYGSQMLTCGSTVETIK